MKRFIALFVSLCLLGSLTVAGAESLTDILLSHLQAREEENGSETPAEESVPAEENLQPVAPPAVTGPIQVGEGIPLSGRIVFNDFANAFGYSTGKGEPYCLMDAHGAPLTDAIFADMESSYDCACFIVRVEGADATRSLGVIDDTGRYLVPAQYAEVKVYSDRWQAGFVVAEADAPDQRAYILYDRETGTKRYYKLDHVDFYLRGQLAGSLSAEEFGMGQVDALGDYFSVKVTPNECHYYGPTLEMSPVVTSYSDEYDYESDYSGGTSHYIYTHAGTGQRAFEPGCTLTPDEVEMPFARQNEGVVDLQGNLVLPMEPDTWFYLSPRGNGYSVLSTDDGEGLLDPQGRLVVPVGYDSVGTYEDNPLKFGYISAEQNGMVGFLDASGNVAVDFIYPKMRVDVESNFATLNNIDGTVTIISGAAGEFDDSYDYCYTGWQGSAVVEVRKDDQYAVLDQYGRTVIDFMPAKSIYFNVEGTMFLAVVDTNEYMLYAAEAAAPAAPEEEGSTCPSCGFDLGEDPAFNFCPNCGASLK